MGPGAEPELAAAQELLWAGDVDAAARVLTEVVDGSGEPEAYLLRGLVNFMEDRLDDASRDWEEAFRGFRACGDFRRAARAALDLAELHSTSLGHEAAGQGWLGRARRLLDRVGPCVERGWYEIALAACTRGNVDDLRESADRALEIALEHGDPDLEVRALADSGLALVSQGHTRAGFARIDEALAAITGGELRDPSVAGLAFCSMLASCDRSGDVRRAEEWNQLIRALLLERLGDRPRVLHTHCRVAYGSVLFRVGRWQEAEEVMLEALEPSASRSWNHRVDMTARLAELRIDQGRIADAELLLAPHGEAIAACAPLARVQMIRGDCDVAVGIARRGMRKLVGDAVRRGPLLAIVVQAELGRGDLDAAARTARELAELAAETESAALHGEAHLAGGRVALATGDLDGATGSLCDARQSFDAAERPLPSAVATLELATTLAANGHSTDAIVEARAARQTATRLGAQPVADRAAALLRELGDTTRPRATDTVVALRSLTPREAEVLALLRTGCTNPEIGERLFISAKTAEHHVGRVLAKLGVKSRTEAAALATAALADPGGAENGGGA